MLYYIDCIIVLVAYTTNRFVALSIKYLCEVQMRNSYVSKEAMLYVI